MTADATVAIIVHYVRDDLTDALVGDLRAVAGGSVTRIVVVDNGSPVAYQTSPQGSVEVVRLEEGVGFGGAVDVGRDLVSGPHFLLLNNDVRLPHDPVPALLARWRQGRPALVGPRVEYPDGRFQLSWGDELGLAEEGRERRRQRQMRGVGGEALRRREVQSVAARPVDWLSGVALLVDTERFDAVGGFDDAFFFYFEDVDLCRRLRLAGFSLWYEPAAVVHHLLGGTRDSDQVEIPERIGTAHVLGHLRYYRRHRPRWETVAMKGMLLAQVGLSPSYRRQPWQPSLLRRLWKD